MVTETGWYLYAFLSRRDPPPLAGIDGRSPLSVIPENGLAALASPVSLEEFGEEALHRNLQDVRWLEEKVRLHEAIVETAMARGPILPMKFGTICLDAERIRTVIRNNARRLHEALAFLRDKVEWGVKGFASGETLRARVLSSDPALLALSTEARSTSSGQAFFLRKTMAERASARALERQEELTRQALEAIAGAVVDLTTNPPLCPKAPSGETLALHLACLVRREAVPTFVAEVEQWNQRYGHDGFRLVASGPWPPYHFVPELDDEG